MSGVTYIFQTALKIFFYQLSYLVRLFHRRVVIKELRPIKKAIIISVYTITLNSPTQRCIQRTHGLIYQVFSFVPL